MAAGEHTIIRSASNEKMYHGKFCDNQRCSQASATQGSRNISVAGSFGRNAEPRSKLQASPSLSTRR